MTARPHLSEEQQQQRELNARRDLEQLVTLMVNDASDAWRDQELPVRDRAPFYGRSVDLITTVERLSKALLDHPDAGVRADRLIDLHDALEAAAILADCLKNPIAHRRRTAANRKAKAAKDDQRREIVARVAWPAVQKRPNGSPWGIAGDSEKPINDELGKRRLGRMGRDAIADHVKAIWPHLAS
jgi:hypothetical protein